MRNEIWKLGHSSKRRGPVGAAVGLQQALRKPRRGPTPLKVCYISRCLRCSPVQRRCQLVNAHSLAELAAGVIRLQTVFWPGVLLQGGESARSSACQQLIRAALMLAPPRTRALCQTAPASEGVRQRIGGPIRIVQETYQHWYRYQHQHWLARHSSPQPSETHLSLYSAAVYNYCNYDLKASSFGFSSSFKLLLARSVTQLQKCLSAMRCELWQDGRHPRACPLW